MKTHLRGRKRSSRRKLIFGKEEILSTVKKNQKKNQVHKRGRSKISRRRLICSEEDEREEGLSRGKKK